MEFYTVREAAEKWGISQRLVQQHCIKGRIAGAVKFSGAWAIPRDAPKPEDPRKAKMMPGSAAAPECCSYTGRVPMPLLDTPFPLGRCLEAVEAMTDPLEKQLAMAEYYYFTGRAEEAAREAELLLTASDPAVRLSACWVYGYANLANDRIHLSRYALAEIQNTLAKMDETTPPELQALAGCIAFGASVLLHLPLPEHLPDLGQCLRLLPPGLRFFALYVKAHYSYLQKDYRGSLGTVETALALEADRYPISAIYLHLVATMDHMSLKEPERAREHLLRAWELARPDDLIEGFGEHHGLLGGALESVIKKNWPEDFKRIIAITYRFSSGWRKIHNPHTGNDVADNLTTTEFAIAMLAARNWTNQEIGGHMGISPNTVKRHLSTAMQKLHITQRKELGQFMLR